MGYTTEFEGRFTVTPALQPEHAAYLAKFSASRRVRRDEKITAGLPGSGTCGRGSAGRPGGRIVVGDAGGRYRATAEWEASLPQLGVLDYGESPAGQPGLWSQWVPTANGGGIEWNGLEKFYHFEAWLQYLMDEFLTP